MSNYEQEINPSGEIVDQFGRPWGSNEEFPFGPLTPDQVESLEISFYDASRRDEQRVAMQRGIQSGDAMKRAFADYLPQGGEAPQPVVNIDPGLLDGPDWQ